MDAQGRYTLTEMEGRVRDELSAKNLTLDANGFETASAIVNFNVSNQLIDRRINESLVALYTEAMLAHEDLFASDVYMDVLAGQLQYSFPPNMLQLRWMRWKDAGLQSPNLNVPGSSTQIGAHPYDYVPMVQIDDPMDLSMTVDYYVGPTYRRNGDTFVLNDYPQQDNPSGILMNIVALPPQLTASIVGTPSQAVIQGLYARLAQEVVIYDAAYKIASTTNKQVVPEIEKMREEWHQRFITAVENAFHAVSVSMTSGRLIANSFSGRRNVFASSGSRFTNNG